METQIIKYNPQLTTSHQVEFQNFCEHLLAELGKNNIDKENVLLKIKECIYSKYNGEKFHANVDLSFVESLLIDLMQQDWTLRYKNKKVQLELTVDDTTVNIQEEKAKTRRRHLLARDLQLTEPSVLEFIRNMEKRRITAKGWHSIFSVMRDGNELRALLSAINEDSNEDGRLKSLSDVISPYIQFVEKDAICEHTGLNLSDIWRYFRHTWISEYKTLPGRSISILVRDAAAPNHPVIGIAALGSSVAQQTCRDEWIGWDGKTFINKIASNPSAKYGKWIIKTLDMLFEELYIKDLFKEKLITLTDLRCPTKEKIKELKDLSRIFRDDHINNPNISKFTADNKELSWEERAKSKLFKSKRVLLLSELLYIKYVLKKYNYSNGTKKELERCINKMDFRDAVETLIRKQKSVHVGINMMDIIICGAIPPYNHLLGGKLVCMLLSSPEVISYYNNKYADYVSLIASSMCGKPIIRKPQIVLLGTTSLYGAGSSQYNRIKIPATEIGGSKNQKIEYKELGYSEGFGSFHFSKKTIELADAVVGRNNGRRRVNSIFGEGANPLLRKLKDAMEYLKLESKPILNHRNKRIVYGVALTENFHEYLCGLCLRPKYIVPNNRQKYRTQLIAKYWMKRWLLNRISKDTVLTQLSNHSLSYPITHGARVPLKSIENLFD